MSNGEWRGTSSRERPTPPFVIRHSLFIMLSRVANSLYWMSRYIERAENIARILDVNLQLLLDFRSLDDEGLRDHWMPIVQATGDQESIVSQKQRATASAVAEFMVFRQENPNSIVSSICQARENA